MSLTVEASSNASGEPSRGALAAFSRPHCPGLQYGHLRTSIGGEATPAVTHQGLQWGARYRNCPTTLKPSLRTT